jgi:1,4-dihydroxy-2-naphthoyl-CoA hydrolase
MIWFADYKLEALEQFSQNNMNAHLGITFTELGEDFISAKMPVDHRTRQPFGILHGGASVVLAESLGSMGAGLVVDPSKFRCVGLEINANHIRSVAEGFVYGTAKPIHIGRRTQVWAIEIVNEQRKLVCTSRITLAVVEI